MMKRYEVKKDERCEIKRRIKWKEARYLHGQIQSLASQQCKSQGPSDNNTKRSNIRKSNMAVAVAGASFERALSRFSTNQNTISKHVFIQAIMGEYRFENHLNVQGHLARYFDSFFYSENNDTSNNIRKTVGKNHDFINSAAAGVDWRLLLCVYRVVQFTFSNIAYHNNPKKLFFHLFDIFVLHPTINNNRPITNNESIRRKDLLQLISIASITSQEYSDTAMRMDSLMTDTPQHGRQLLINKSQVNDIFDICPGIILSFRDQIFHQIGNQRRLEILATKEQRSYLTFHDNLKKVSLERTLFWWQHRLLVLSTNKWKAYTQRQVQNQRNSLWILLWKTKHYVLKEWRLFALSQKHYKMNIRLAQNMGTHHNKQMYFQRWKQFVSLANRIRKACIYTNQSTKKIRSGFGTLRIFWINYKRKQYFSVWLSHIQDEWDLEKAVEFHIRRTKSQVFRHLHRFTLRQKSKRIQDRQAYHKQDWLMEVYDTIDHQVQKIKYRQLQEEQEKEKQINHHQLYVENMNRQRIIAEQKRKEELIQQVQKEARQKQVASRKLYLMTTFEDKWSAKIDKIERNLIPSVDKEWGFSTFFPNNNTSQSKQKTPKGELFMKAFKLLERDFYQAPDPTDQANIMREKMLSSGANICIAIIDSILFQKQILIDDFVEKVIEYLEPISTDNISATTGNTIPTGGHYHKHKNSRIEKDQSGEQSQQLTFQKLCEIIESFDIEIYPSTIRPLYDELMVVPDVKNDTSPTQLHKNIVRNLKQCIHNSFQYLGPQGSKWKKYINPIHEIMMYHNIITGKKVYDYEMKTNILKEICRENIRANFVLEARIKYRIEKKQDFLHLVENDAANIIRKMFLSHKEKKKWNRIKGPRLLRKRMGKVKV